MKLIKQKYFLILAAAVLLIGLLSGCGNEADETDEAVTQESLYQEETEENDVQQDDIADEMPDWLAAYADYVEGMEDDACSCGFFYVDEDDIPEFIIRADKYEIVLTFHDGVVDALQVGRLRLQYIEKKNLFCVTSGQAGEYTDQIYSIENSKWTYVAGGKYVLAFQDGMYVDKFSFEWEGEEVEEELYWENFYQVFDEEQAVVPEEYMRCDTMLSHIEAGDFAWVLTAEPYTYTYNAEIIEDFEYSDKYIPISKVDFASYKNEMSEEDWQALSSFFPILLEGKTFTEQDIPYWTADFKEQSINDLLSIFDEYPDKFILDKFALCDLTGDGQKELVVYTNFSIGLYWIFHKEGDDFYAVWLGVREFMDLQKNGIYTGCDSAFSTYYYRLHFLKDIFWGERIALQDAGYYENYYVIGSEKVSEAEMEAWEDEMMVGEVVWYHARVFKDGPEVPEIYGNVLGQYAQAIREDVDWDTFYERQMNGEWRDVFWYPFYGRSGEREMYYCLKDLTGDGFPELIMGYNPMSIDLIYYYNQEIGTQCVHMSDYWDLTLYEGGVVRYEHGFLYTTYYQFQSDTEKWEAVVRSEYSWDEDANRYYRESGDDLVEIEEDEYQRIVDELTREPIEPIELEWALLDVW